LDEEKDLGEGEPSLSEEIATFGCYANFAARKVRVPPSPNLTLLKNLSKEDVPLFSARPLWKGFVFLCG
jgi:hypothetical protein